MNYFKNCQTLDEAKKLFWDLAKKHHPDKGGDTATFQEILNQFERFRPASENEKFTGEFEQWRATEYAHILDKLIKIPAVTVEICGSWIWISGPTKQYKDLIKAIDPGETFRRGFSRPKGMWYFSPKGYRKKSRRELDIDEIRDLYGSQRVQKDERDSIAA